MSAPVKSRPPRVGDAPLFRRALIGVVLALVAIVIVAPLVVIGVPGVLARRRRPTPPQSPIPIRCTPSC